MESVLSVYNLLKQKDEKKNLLEYQKMIANKENITLIKQNLSEIIELEEKQARYFAAGFMFYYYSNQLIQNKELEYNQTFLQHCQELCNSLKILSLNYNQENLDSFKQAFDKYCKGFVSWKEHDMFEMVQDLTKIYWELEMQIYSQKKMGKELSPEVSKIIKQKQQTVLEKIKKFGGKKGIEYFSNYTPVIFNQDSMNNIQNQIKENFDKAFWDLFEKNIEEKKYDQLLKAMIEIKLNLKSLVPNRADFHQQLDENMDIEFLKEMLQNDAVDGSYIYNMICYIVQKIKSLEAPADNQDTEKWKKSIDQLFTQRSPHHQILAKFFKKVYQKLEKITKEVKMVKNSKLFEAIKNNKPPSNNTKII